VNRRRFVRRAVSTVVLDTSALLAFLYGEPGEASVRRLLADAVDGRVTVRLHRLHMTEAYYLFYRSRGERTAEAMVQDVQRLPVRIEDRIFPPLLREAGRLKASYRISLADAFAAGLARLRGAALMSCDRKEFAPLESSGEVTVTWAR
jgi:predicted nucleic acid-binding protein